MTCHIIISGFVQGIGFRVFIRKFATSLGLTGWTKNTTDGKVEAVFVGPKDKIEEIIKLCRKGPFLANVKNLEVDWKNDDEKFDYFEIIK